MSERYGHLVLIERTSERYRGNVVGLWRCDCGAEKRLPMTRVRIGQAKSCGCLKTKHGQSTGLNKTPEYVAWGAMHARCRAKQGRDFAAYGARGIGVCDEWSEFAPFLEAMGRKPSPAHSLGRKDNNKGYSPDNCRWETPAEQMSNTSKSKTWHIRGEKFSTLRKAAARFGVDHKTIRYWVNTNKENCYAVGKY